MTAFLLSDLARRFGGEVAGDDARVSGVGSLRGAGAGDLTFYAGGAREDLARTAAAAVVLRAADRDAADMPRWITGGDPRLAFSRAAELLAPPPPDIAGISPLAAIDAAADIGEGAAVAPGAVIAAAKVGADCRIHAGVVIGAGAVVGAGSILYPRVVLYANARIGRGCVLHAGVVIGAEGFGYAADDGGRREKLRHVAGVVVGDNVEIGANSTIDRGMLDDTVIGDGVKIDNLVQVGHNVKIGADSVICGNVGIAGGAVIGRGCVVAGGAGIANRVVVGDGARIGGHSPVTRDVPAGADVLSVWPAMPARYWWRLVAAARRLRDSRS